MKGFKRYRRSPPKDCWDDKVCIGLMSILWIAMGVLGLYAEYWEWKLWLSFVM